jgi:citronellol/citronellal dehydrogenase
MGRTPEILADSAYVILNRDSRTFSGHFCIDDEVLASEGTTDLSAYAFAPGTQPLVTDLFLD